MFRKHKQDKEPVDQSYTIDKTDLMTDSVYDIEWGGSEQKTKNKMPAFHFIDNKQAKGED